MDAMVSFVTSAMMILEEGNNSKEEDEWCEFFESKESINALSNLMKAFFDRKKDCPICLDKL